MRRRKKSPAFLFYTQDWLVGTKFFSFHEKGIYTDLLSYQHQSENGVLSKEEVLEISLGEWSAKVMKKFTQDSEGNYYHPKLKEVMTESQVKSAKQSELANRRWTDAKASKGHVPNECLALEKEDEDDNDNTIEAKTRNYKQTLEQLYDEL